MGSQCYHQFHASCMLQYAQSLASQTGDHRLFFRENPETGRDEILPEMVEVFPAATKPPCPSCRKDFCGASHYRRVLGVLDDIKRGVPEPSEEPAIDEMKKLITDGTIALLPMPGDATKEIAVSCGVPTERKPNFSLFLYSQLLREVGFEIDSIPLADEGGVGKAWCRHVVTDVHPHRVAQTTAPEGSRLVVQKPTYWPKATVRCPTTGLMVPKMKGEGGWLQLNLLATPALEDAVVAQRRNALATAAEARFSATCHDVESEEEDDAPLTARMGGGAARRRRSDDDEDDQPLARRRRTAA